MIQPYTKADLEKGEQIVRELLSGIRGFPAWAERIAKAIAAERENSADMLAALEAIVHPDNEGIVWSCDAWAMKLKQDALAAMAKARGTATTSAMDAQEQK